MGSNRHTPEMLAHLEVLRADGRDEIKRRITQRDIFSIQLVLVVTASGAVAAAGGERYLRALLAVPPAVGFFVLMILYSYRVHDHIVAYLRWEIEPRIAEASGTPIRLEWETYYGARQVPGLRRTFYKHVLAFCSLAFPTMVAISESEGGGLLYFVLALILGAFYLAGAAWIYRRDFALRGQLSSSRRRLALRDRGTARGWPLRPPPGPSRKIAVFVDRDGTINRDTHYPNDPKKLEFLPGATKAMATLAKLDVHVFVITNQAGIALGIHGPEETRAFNRELMHRIGRSGGRVDATYFCPEQDAALADSAMPESPCAKPNPGMLLDAAADFGLDLEASFMVGDKMSDVVAGRAVGCTTVLVSTGKAGRQSGRVSEKPHHRAADLAAAVEWIRPRVAKQAHEAKPKP